MNKSAINEFEIDYRREENETTKLMLHNFYQNKNRFLSHAALFCPLSPFALSTSAMHRRERERKSGQKKKKAKKEGNLLSIRKTQLKH